MSSKECSYCGKVCTRLFNFRRHTPVCKMNEQCYGFNPNIGSQELHEDSDMSSAEGSDVNFLESQSDLSSEVRSSDDEREGEAENEFPWSDSRRAIARTHFKYQERGDPPRIAEAKARNKKRKELRKVLIHEKLEWMHEMK